MEPSPDHDCSDASSFKKVGATGLQAPHLLTGARASWQHPHGLQTAGSLTGSAGIVTVLHFFSVTVYISVVGHYSVTVLGQFTQYFSTFPSWNFFFVDIFVIFFEDLRREKLYNQNWY